MSFSLAVVIAVAIAGAAFGFLAGIIFVAMVWTSCDEEAIYAIESEKFDSIQSAPLSEDELMDGADSFVTCKMKTVDIESNGRPAWFAWAIRDAFIAGAKYVGWYDRVQMDDLQARVAAARYDL